MQIGGVQTQMCPASPFITPVIMYHSKYRRRTQSRSYVFGTTSLFMKHCWNTKAVQGLRHLKNTCWIQVSGGKIIHGAGILFYIISSCERKSFYRTLSFDASSCTSLKRNHVFLKWLHTATLKSVWWWGGALPQGSWALVEYKLFPFSPPVLVIQIPPSRHGIWTDPIPVARLPALPCSSCPPTLCLCCL